MGEVGTSSKRMEADALIELNSEILDQVRKDLSQEYIRFMSRMLKEGGRTSGFEDSSKPGA